VSARRLAAVPLAPVDPVATAQAAVDEAARALDTARVAEAWAVAEYDADEQLQDAAARARVARERAERRHAARLEELAAAQRVRADEQREADTGEMQRAIAFVAGLVERVRPALAVLVALDRRASEIVDRIADAVVEAEDVYLRALELGQKLERPAEVQRQIGRPTLAWFALLARVAIARDRAAGGRDLANGWVQAETEPGWDSKDRPAFDAAVKQLEEGS